MRLADIIAYAVADYWDNKFKTLLSCLGIIIGVAAIITLLTVSAGVFSGLTDRFSNIETDTILISPHAYSGVGSVLTDRGTVARTHLPPAQFTDEDVQLLRNTSGVAAVYPEISTSKEVVYLNDTEYVQAVKAVVPGMSRYADMVRSGRYLAASDMYAVVIGSAVADGMFLDDVKTGDNLTIYSNARDRSQKYTVVGVLRQINTSSVSGDPNSAIYMTSAGLKKIDGLANYTSIVVKASSVTGVDVTARNVNGTMAALHASEDFSVMSSQALTDAITSVFDMITYVLTAISAISLVVGGIGIMNVMLLTVKERVKEIGLMKAVGARKRDIRLLFITEAVTLGLFSGLAGVACAAVLSMAIGRLAGIPVIMTPLNVVVGVGFGVFTTAVAGFYPAGKAAKLDPIEALRTE